MRLAVVQRILGLLLMVFSITMLPPVAVSIYFNDGAIHAFEQAFGISLLGGFLIWFPTRRHVEELRLRDGFLIVAAFWIGLGTVGSLPFLFMDAPSLSVTDAMFELPSEENVDKLIITRDYAEKKIGKSKYSKLKVA